VARVTFQNAESVWSILKASTLQETDGIELSGYKLRDITMKIHLLSSFTIIVITIISITGCTSQNAYDSLRYHQELDCQKIQGADRDDCMRRFGMSYDEYQRQLDKQQPQK
jgi:hypothetical protein